MSDFKLSRMSSSSTVKTCVPVGFYVLWYVLIHDQEIISLSWPKPDWTFHVVYVPSYKLVSLYWFLKGIFGSFGSFFELMGLGLSVWYGLSVLTPATCLLASLAIIPSLTTLLDRMANVTRPHVWSYQVWNQWKTYVDEKTCWFLGTGQECKDGLLPSIKRNSFWEVGDVHYCDNGGVPLCYVFVWSIFYAMGQQQQYDSLRSFRCFYRW